MDPNEKEYSMNIHVSGCKAAIIWNLRRLIQELEGQKTINIAPSFYTDEENLEVKVFEQYSPQGDAGKTLDYIHRLGEEEEGLRSLLEQHD